jgi:hypothetical protein
MASRAAVKITSMPFQLHHRSLSSKRAKAGG